MDFDLDPLYNGDLESVLIDFIADRENGYEDPGVDQALDEFDAYPVVLSDAYTVLCKLEEVVSPGEYRDLLRSRVEKFRPLLDLLRNHEVLSATLAETVRALLIEPMDIEVEGGLRHLWANESPNSLHRMLAVVSGYMDPVAALNDPCVAVRMTLALMAEDADVLTRLAEDRCDQVRDAVGITVRRMQLQVSVTMSRHEDPDETELSEIALCPCSTWVETEPPWYADVLPERLPVPRVHSSMEKHIREWEVHHAATQPYPDPLSESFKDSDVVEYLKSCIPDQYALTYRGDLRSTSSIHFRLALGDFAATVTTGTGASTDSFVDQLHEWKEVASYLVNLDKRTSYEFDRVSSRRTYVLELDILNKVHRLHTRTGSEWFTHDFKQAEALVYALGFVLDPIQTGDEATAEMGDVDLLVSPYRWFFEDQDDFSRFIPHAWLFAKRQLLPPPIPAYSNRGSHARLAFFEAGHHLVRYGLGWRDIAKGFAEWDKSGRPTSDPMMSAVVGWFREYLPAYIAWAFNSQDRLEFMPQALLKDLRHFEKADPYISSIWSGGWDPLHLTLHETGEERESAEAVAQKQPYSNAFLLMVPKYANFYEHMVSLMVSQEIDKVEVVMPALGKLPEFSLDEVTERAHATDVKIHRWGN